MVEELELHVLAKIVAGLLLEIGRAHPVAVGSGPAAVEPRSNDKHVKNTGVLPLDMLIGL